jgi:hypothetical protein
MISAIFKRDPSTMPTLAQKPATTLIPIQLSDTDFHQFLLSYLSLPKCGPRCKLGYHRVFSLILWSLYTGRPWQCWPVPKDVQRRAALPDPTG